jgi:hypothetical protein
VTVPPQLSPKSPVYSEIQKIFDDHNETKDSRKNIDEFIQKEKF